MNTVITYLVTSLGFALLVAMGSREKRNAAAEERAFFYQRAILIALGTAGFLWIFLAAAVLWLGFPHGGMAPMPLAVYSCANAMIVLAYFYGYLWYRAYSVEISGDLIIRSLRHTKRIAFDDVTEARIVEGKDTTRMILFWGNPRKKLVLSGLLVESGSLFEEIANRLLAKKCTIKKRNYIGQWTVIH